jgi:hypothetical protein
MNNVERLFSERPSAVDFADGYLGYLAHVFARMDRDAIAAFIDVLEHARTSGGTVFFCGNGGSES